MNSVKSIFHAQATRWVLAFWIAFVFIQSLFFKFTNAVETQHIFGTLGVWSGLSWFGDYGGYLVGIVELIASLLLLTRLWPWGAALAFAVMSGAIFFHLFTPLGVVMPAFDESGQISGDDGGTLFIMACITWLAALLLLVRDLLSGRSQLLAMRPGVAYPQIKQR